MRKLFEEISFEEKSIKREITVTDKMQNNYKYVRTKAPGDWKSEYPDFKPELTPKQMMEAGVFEGKYLNDCKKEFPELFSKAKISETADPEINFFKVKSRQPLSVWKENGWINRDDPRGWFQWYCRFYYGRRHKDDDRQVKRWKSFVARHGAQLTKNCKKGDFNCRPVQRQGLLQWAIDSRKM